MAFSYHLSHFLHERIVYFHRGRARRTVRHHDVKRQSACPHRHVQESRLGVRYVDLLRTNLSPSPVMRRPLHGNVYLVAVASTRRRCASGHDIVADDEHLRLRATSFLHTNEVHRCFLKVVEQLPSPSMPLRSDIDRIVMVGRTHAWETPFGSDPLQLLGALASRQNVRTGEAKVHYQGVYSIRRCSGLIRHLRVPM